MSTSPSEPRPPGTVRLLRSRWLEVDVHVSLFIVMVLVAVAMATSMLPGRQSESAYTTSELWLLGFACAGILFASLVIHEGAHLVADALRGRPNRRLSLVFLHSPHAPLPEPGTGPWGEVLVATSGPLATLATGLVALVLEAAFAGHRMLEPLFEFAGVTNLLFAAIQFVPGHPLDGGRVLRAIAWGIAGDPATGTRWACRVSLAFAIVLGVASLAAFPFMGSFFSLPLWGCLMAFVLAVQSAAIARLAKTRERLGGLSVAHVMEPLPEALPRIQSVADALATSAARGVSAFLVEFQGRLGGIVTVDALEGVPEDERFQTPVGQVTRRLERQHLLEPAMALEGAFRRMGEEGLPLLPVLASGELVGVLRRETVARVLEGRGR